MKDLFTISELEPSVLAAEAARVRGVLAALVPQRYVFEVGSTAVPGVIGKQDIDFLIRVPASAFGKYRAVLDDALKRNAQQLSNEHFQGYLVDSKLDVAIQFTVAGSPQDTFLEFLELLRSQTGLIDEYNQLKRRFDGQAMELYRAAKRDFIETALSSGKC